MEGNRANVCPNTADYVKGGICGGLLANVKQGYARLLEARGG